MLHLVQGEKERIKEGKPKKQTGNKGHFKTKNEEPVVLWNIKDTLRGEVMTNSDTFFALDVCF